MREATIGYAKDHLSALIKSLEDGDETEIVILNRSTPVARLLPCPKVPPREKIFGMYADDPGVLDWEAFDAMDDEIADMFGVLR